MSKRQVVVRIGAIRVSPIHQAWADADFALMMPGDYKTVVAALKALEKLGMARGGDVVELETEKYMEGGY